MWVCDACMHANMQHAVHAIKKYLNVYICMHKALKRKGKNITALATKTHQQCGAIEDCRE